MTQRRARIFKSGPWVNASKATRHPIVHTWFVQYKDSLEAADWTNASGLITGNSTTKSFTDGSGSPRRFYRVIAVQ